MTLRLSPAMAAPLVLSLAASGCFYDSRWGQTKTAQKHNAVAATPAALPSAPAHGDAPSSTAAHVLHVRVYATPAYAAQTVDWERHVRTLADDASATLRGAIDAELVIDDARPWKNADGKDRLETSLAALRDDDTGEGVDLVIAFIGGLSITTRDFDQLGMSEMPGKHMVVRAPSTLEDFDAIEKAFDELSEEERARVRRERRHHRELAVLLHEIGHALGAPHASDRRTLMFASYDKSMSAFGPDAIAAMRARFDVVARAGVAKDGVAKDDAPSTPAAGKVAPPPPAPSTTSAPPRPPPAGLTPADADAYARAAAIADGDPNGATAIAAPLFAKYPAVFEVQDLRCKIAMARGLDWKATHRECDPVMKLTTGRGGE